jgi:mono/diheme cytochrome c family protein
MYRYIVGRSLALLLFLAASGVLFAAGEHQRHSQHEEHGHHETHKHHDWPAPPAAYADKISHRWGDAGAIARGKALYDTHCTVCHGADGRGMTAFAKTLPHPPADLLHHFHPRPGDGDAYLFWRVSEGGTVEPFKAAGSLMPAFNKLLNEPQIWDVLAYVCAVFHKAFE